MEEVKALSDLILPEFLVQFFFAYCENTYFEKAWFDGLGAEAQEFLKKRAENESPYDNYPNYEFERRLASLASCRAPLVAGQYCCERALKNPRSEIPLGPGSHAGSAEDHDHARSIAMEPATVTRTVVRIMITSCLLVWIATL
jgi:hypothetical protein